jgi:hypothetical protein
MLAFIFILTRQADWPVMVCEAPPRHLVAADARGGRSARRRCWSLTRAGSGPVLARERLQGLDAGYANAREPVVVTGSPLTYSKRA